MWHRHSMGHKDHVKPSTPSKPYDTCDSSSISKNANTRTNDYWYISFDEKEKGKVSTNGHTAEEVKQHNAQSNVWVLTKITKWWITINSQSIQYLYFCFYNIILFRASECTFAYF